MTVPTALLSRAEGVSVPLGPERAEAIRKSMSAIAAGEVISFEDMKVKLGLG